jgi:hypothetical protein
VLILCVTSKRTPAPLKLRATHAARPRFLFACAPIASAERVAKSASSQSPRAEHPAPVRAERVASNHPSPEPARRRGRAEGRLRKAALIDKKCPSKSFTFNQLQKSAYLTEKTRYQPTSFHTHPHSFPANLLQSSSYDFGTGVYIPCLDQQPPMTQKAPIRIESSPSHARLHGVIR